MGGELVKTMTRNYTYNWEKKNLIYITLKKIKVLKITDFKNPNEHILQNVHGKRKKCPIGDFGPGLQAF